MLRAPHIEKTAGYSKELSDQHLRLFYPPLKFPSLFKQCLNFAFISALCHFIYKQITPSIWDTSPVYTCKLLNFLFYYFFLINVMFISFIQLLDTALKNNITKSRYFGFKRSWYMEYQAVHVFILLQTVCTALIIINLVFFQHSKIC